MVETDKYLHLHIAENHTLTAHTHPCQCSDILYDIQAFPQKAVSASQPLSYNETGLGAEMVSNTVCFFYESTPPAVKYGSTIREQLLRASFKAGILAPRFVQVWRP